MTTLSRGQYRSAESIKDALRNLNISQRDPEYRWLFRALRDESLAPHLRMEVNADVEAVKLLVTDARTGLPVSPLVRRGT